MEAERFIGGWEVRASRLVFVVLCGFDALLEVFLEVARVNLRSPAPVPKTYPQDPRALRQRVDLKVLGATADGAYAPAVRCLTSAQPSSFAFCAANSSSVRTPSLCSFASFSTSSIGSGSAGAAGSAEYSSPPPWSPYIPIWGAA